jgi:hypothetical protein
MKVFLLFFTIAVFNNLNLDAQVTFERSYGGVDGNWFNDVRQTSDSGYIMTGGAPGPGYQTYVVRTNQFGDTLWVRTFYGTTAGQIGFGVIQAADGNFVVCGYKNFSSSSDCDMHLVKLDDQGNTIWERTAGSSGCQWGQAVAQMQNGNYIVGGWPIFIRDSLGLPVSQSSAAYGQVMAIAPTSDNGFILSSFSSNTIYLQKLDSNGISVWYKPYPGTMINAHSHSVQQTTDGGYILSAEDPSFAGALLIKTDAAGDTLWTRHYWDGDATSVTQTSDGGYAYTGSTWDTAGVIDLLLVRTDSNGDTLWKRSFGHSFELSRGLSMQETSDRGFIIAGYGVDTDGVWHSLLVKTDSLGNVLTPFSGIAEFPVGNISVYPNPFTNSATIAYTGNANLGGAVLHIYAMQGNEVAIRPFDGKNTVVERNGLANGIYFFRIENENGIIGAGKFILQ